ncbi:hypothetical protein ACQJBY_054041 [Aegilops geniculata]
MPLASTPSTCNWVLLFEASCKSTLDFFFAREVDPRLATGSSVFLTLANGPRLATGSFVFLATCKWTLDLQLGLLFSLPLASGPLTCNCVICFFMRLASGHSTCN